MNAPFIGRVSWKLITLLVVIGALLYGSLAYFIRAEMGSTLYWCAAKGERCTIAREVDQNSVNALREKSGLEVAK